MLWYLNPSFFSLVRPLRRIVHRYRAQSFPVPSRTHGLAPSHAAPETLCTLALEV